jgi:hypothetical protein
MQLSRKADKLFRNAGSWALVKYQSITNNGTLTINVPTGYSQNSDRTHIWAFT